MKSKLMWLLMSLTILSFSVRAEDKPASLVDQGKQICEKKKCSICHTAGKSAKPFAEGVAGKTDEYLKGALLDPKKTIAADTKMPSYAGKLTDDEVKAVIEYIKTAK